MNTSFLGLDTTLKYPYKDPKFFPNSSRHSTVHRQSLPNLISSPRLSQLSRHQTFSYNQNLSESSRANGTPPQVISKSWPIFFELVAYAQQVREHFFELANTFFNVLQLRMEKDLKWLVRAKCYMTSSHELRKNSD